MRYPISFNAPSKIFLGLFGSGPSRSYVEVTPETVEAKLGFAGNVTINRSDIVSVEHGVNVPWWMGIGMHAIPGTVALNGSLGNAIKITARPGKSACGQVLFFAIRPHTIYVSVENGEQLTHELGFSPG